MPSTGIFGFVCIHWSLGGLILIGLAASEYSGAGTIVALAISIVTVTISAICGLYYDGKSSGKRKPTDICHFMVIWFNILELLMAGATCARIASATVDYTSNQKLRSWLFGIESHSLGEPWPDVLGVSIIAVVSALFMLGLERSKLFSVLLYITMTSAYTLFVTVGSLHTDIKFWSWTEDFMNRNWTCILVTSALCSYGFIGDFTKLKGNTRYIKAAIYIIVPFICYSLITLTFTLMSHYREIAGTAIPLVRVFEVRDVGWPRLAMAICTICVVCLVLTEVMPELYALVMCLAKKEWQILVTPILYRSTTTGAPILAIFVVGSLSSILAFACPLTYLVRLLNASARLKATMITMIVIYQCFKSNLQSVDNLFQNSSVQYSKLRKERRVMKPSNSIINASLWHKKPKSKIKNEYQSDKEYLLLDNYTYDSSNSYRDGMESSDSEEDKNVTTRPSDSESSGSSTDIDAAVKEYKDKVKVSTSNNFPEQSSPTLAHQTIVFVVIKIVVISAIYFALNVSSMEKGVYWLIFIIICICIVILYLLPKNVPDELQASKLYPFLPSLGILSIVSNMTLITLLSEDTWPGILFWLISGFLLYCHCACCYCDDHNDNITIYRRSEPAFVEIDDPEERYVDTVIIPR
nr:cationic amino acid transporter 2 isoform X1 [Onthophagus taurus]XP_022920949.1 cationic amino acid transporter 2 isoform X1 [Onthophagus taurus]